MPWETGCGSRFGLRSRITFASLLNDAFSDGERVTQSLPASAKWLGNTATALTVTGSALNVAPGGDAIAHFTSTAALRALDDLDYIVARFSIVLSGSSFSTTSDFFRVALLNSHGSLKSPRASMTPWESPAALCRGERVST